jgi:putative ABC transport system permease protein
MMVIAGGGKDLPPPDMTVTTLTLEDAAAIRDEIEGLEAVAPQAWRFNMDLKHGARQIQAVVWGVEPNWHDAWNWYPSEGNGITDEDVASLARVCVIGSSVKRDLFDNADPVGQTLYVNKVALTVTGVLEHRGTGGMGGVADFDNRIIIPITTAMRRVMNVDYVGAIRVVTKDAAAMPRQAEAIRELLHQRHHIVPPQEDDFRIITPDIIAQLVRGTSRTLSYAARRIGRAEPVRRRRRADEHPVDLRRGTDQGDRAAASRGRDARRYLPAVPDRIARGHLPWHDTRQRARLGPLAGRRQR